MEGGRSKITTSFMRWKWYWASTKWYKYKGGVVNVVGVVKKLKQTFLQTLLKSVRGVKC